MPELSKEVLVSETAIATRVAELAAEINRRQDGRPLVAIGILKGSFIFLADLVRQISCPITCEFIRVRMSEGGNSSSPREIHYDASFNVAGKDILIVEDILDTGITIDYLIQHFKQQGATSIQVCVLLDKKESHKVAVPVDYVGFEIPKKFVVGYGLDFEERYRELPHITWLEGVSWPLAD